ncbi:MAG: hypothetical protein ACRBBP_01595 [Bdellovibrionales bacterium]
MKKQTPLIIISCSLGFYACIFLQAFDVPPVLSSVLVGLAGSFLPTSKKYSSKELIACIYTGSFAAMSASPLSLKIEFIILPILISASYLIFSRFCRGFGGKLGTIAFLATVSFTFLKALS